MNLKGFDFFKKVHSDIETSTLTGGVFSILAFIVIILILVWFLFVCLRNLILPKCRDT